jgi:hypothetical protein
LDRSKSACSLGQNRLSANTFWDVFGGILGCLSIIVFSMVLDDFVYLGAIIFGAELGKVVKARGTEDQIDKAVIELALAAARHPLFHRLNAILAVTTIRSEDDAQ